MGFDTRQLRGPPRNGQSETLANNGAPAETTAAESEAHEEEDDDDEGRATGMMLTILRMLTTIVCTPS